VTTDHVSDVDEVWAQVSVGELTVTDDDVFSRQILSTLTKYSSHHR